MATNTSSYELYFTDRNRSFSIAPYTTDGPTNPLTQSTSSKSVSINTSLLLFGKGMPDYGERTADNLINMLENFSNDNEPVSPISGQIWYDTLVERLKVYNQKAYKITNVSINSQTPANSTVTVSGNQMARFNGLNTRGLKTMMMSDDTVPMYQSYAVGLSTYNSGNNTTLINLNNPNLTIDVLNWTLGGWDDVNQSNIGIPAEDIDQLDIYSILRPLDPINDDMVGDRGYNDQRYLKLDTTNILSPFNVRDVNISNVLDPLLPKDAATKNYVDTARYIKISGNVGDDMTGRLVLVGNPVNGNDATNKNYVDTEIAAVAGEGGANSLNDLSDVSIVTPTPADILYFDLSAGMWINKASAAIGFLQLSGGVMTGPLEVNIPSLDNQAANKKFVDDEFDVVTGGTFSVVTDGTYDPGSGILTMIRSNGDSFDVSGFSSGGSANGTTGITHLNQPVYDESSTTSDFIENALYTSPSYPNLQLNVVLQKMSEFLALSQTRNIRSVVVADGIEINFSLLGDTYIVGYNMLQVFVDGIKQVADFSGFAGIGTTTNLPYTLTSVTGYNSATTYTMDVQFEGNPPITVSVIGADALTFDTLLSQLNSKIDDISNSFGYGGHAAFDNGRIVIVSDLPGSGSGVTITDSNFVSGITGEDISGATAWDAITPYITGDIVINFTEYYTCLQDNTGFDPASAPDFWRPSLYYVSSVEDQIGGASYDYFEIGQYRTPSQSFTFASPPATNAIVEIIVNNMEKTFV